MNDALPQQDGNGDQPLGDPVPVATDELDIRPAKPLPWARRLDTKDNKLGIKHCHSCQGPHEGLDVHEYATRTPPYTHYYFCPTTGDPCGLTLLTCNDLNIEVEDNVASILHEAIHSGKWLLFVAHIDDGIVCRRITEKYPTDAFENTWKNLRKLLRDEVGPPEQTEMQSAAPPKPLTQLFGNQ